MMDRKKAESNLAQWDALSIKDKMGILHGKTPDTVFVILSKDGSTVVRDPGLNRPYSGTNKKIVEHIAKGIPGTVVVTLAEAIKSVTYHPKNLPKNLPAGFRLPDAPKD